MLRGPWISLSLVLILHVAIASQGSAATVDAQVQQSNVVTPPRSTTDPAPPTVLAGSGGGGRSNTGEVIASTVKKVRPSGGDQANGDRPGDAVATDNTTHAPDPCYYLPQSAEAARAAGHDPATGVLYLAKCPHQTNVAGSPDGLRYTTAPVWAASGQPPAAPPPPSAQELAQQAAASVTVPAPVVHMGPSPDRVAVKIPVWLWVERVPPLTVTVAVPGLTVNATATLTSTQWSMGEPVTEPDSLSSRRVASFSCTGTGEAPAGEVDSAVIPPCGYTYRYRSTSDRTGGTKRWQVTSVAHWTFTWTASNGQTDDIPLQSVSTVAVPVGEWRVALVDHAEPTH